MLSVWKLAHGQEAYYLNAVAAGVEDYYVGGEAPGRWIASSDQLLGLNGVVTPEALRHVFAGHDPSTGTRLGQPHRVPGYDLTFRAPKSVSVLFGLGDADTARAVRDAHEHAVAAALDFAERHAVWSRRGHGGFEQVRGEGLIAAAFRHRTSRNGDPHLHTHVLVPNMVLGADGRWATLDGRWIYTGAKTVGYLYEAQLRHNLTKALGVEWGPVINGIADIDGVPASVLRAFSTRRAEIEERMTIRGQHSPKAAMIAALDTRKAKDNEIDPIRLRTAWSTKAAEFGFDAESVRSILDRTKVPTLDATYQQRIEDQLLSPGGLTAHESSFDRNDILRAWCDALPDGASIEDLEQFAEALVDRLAVARLDGVSARGPVIRSTSGRVLSSLPAGERWTTFDLLNTEHFAVETARRLLDQEIAVCDANELLVALRSSPSLSEEQVRAVVQMTTSGNGIDILTAPAGAGKTYALATAREAWERSGYRVIGAAHTGVAADEITNAAGIASTTIARLRIAFERGEPGGLDDRTVLVVDEAGTAGTRDLAAILDHVERAGAKVVLVGDPKQLPEIAAGGLFSGLIARQPVIELTDNRRQREEWEREALRQVRDGDTAVAIAAYREHRRITIGETADETKALLVADWWASRVRGEDAIMLAARRSEVAELNIHGRMRASLAGHLAGEVLDVGGTPFQVGDAVMTLRNDRRLGVRNGNRGVVVDLDPDARTMRVRLIRGDVDLEARYVDAGHVGHAYAMTVNKAHGLTCDRTMTLGNDQIYRELAYEALSRGRLSNHVYISRSCVLDLTEDGPHARTIDSPEPMDTLEQGLRRRHWKRLALDSMAIVPIEAWTTTDLLSERERVQHVLAQAPADRSRDLVALLDSRRESIRELREAELNMARLECRKRPLRERRRPDVELIQATNCASRLRDRVDQLDTEITRVESSQHRRHSHLAAHQADTLQLRAIDGVLDERIRKTVVRDVAEPPAFITRVLGPRPTDRVADSAWVKAVVVIEKYRVEHDITDKRTAVGPQPSDLRTQLDWSAAHEAIADAQARLDISVGERQTSVSKVEPPSLGLGL